ncbi:hypothetical protein C0585_06445 [Candidatus Woesearchaeota archaeon]|nr:MAG: hypothetical protein C0585_06445 [Candidatus Woesearchaeota archaeon]
MSAGGNLSDLNYDSDLNYKGYFDFQEILRFMKKWMEDRDLSFYERRVNVKGDLKGNRYKIKLEGDKRINPYVKWYLIVEIFGFDIDQREVVEKGKKVKKDYGRLKFIFDGKIILDPDNQWESSEFMEKLRDKFFHGKVVKWDNDMVWSDELYYLMYALKEDFSRYLGMYCLG